MLPEVHDYCSQMCCDECVNSATCPRQKYTGIINIAPQRTTQHTENIHKHYSPPSLKEMNNEMFFHVWSSCIKIQAYLINLGHLP